jgi:TfoX/Sxy family transcriptional regulator of competence genes
MAYDEELAGRVREYVLDQAGGPGQTRAVELTEKRMFGGLAFLLDGNLAVSVSGGGGLLLRVDPQQAPELIREPCASRFVIRGREMNGWLHIAADAATSDDELDRWVSHGVTYARSLPPK